MTRGVPRRAVRLGTRGSALALTQTRLVASLLRSQHPSIEFTERVIGTQGDRDRETPLPAIGGKGVFTEDLEKALRAREIDAAVHSLKDLPVDTAADLVIAAVPVRADARDALVSTYDSIAAMPAGATVGTSSVRRAALLRWVRRDLCITPLRGNVETRVGRVRSGALEAIIVAAAGMLRLGLEAEITTMLPVEPFLPAPGQGAIAVQCLADDAGMVTLLGVIDDARARAETTAERAFLRILGGGCSMPISALAEAGNGHDLLIRGLVCSADGERVLRVSAEGALDDAERTGLRLGEQALRLGAAELIA
ncbi:MAG: hydroxymethylbilane synthase [Gemmatimonadetes bacterium]|nr:hydroxymethylbilane synthase [Gemmatimonadota bacterium]